MPQEFQTLRCYKCEKFQVHQTKKATKWQCKVCGEKQSLVKAYFIGSARDCRLNVQQLNFKDGEQKQNFMIEQGNKCIEDFEESSALNWNHIDEYESSSETFQSFKDTPGPREDYLPKKRARCEPDPSFEPFSGNQSVLSSIFLEDNKTSSLDPSRSTNTSSHKENISFDVTFDLFSSSRKASDHEVYNNETGDLKNKTGDLKNKTGLIFNDDMQLPRKKTVVTKNRGFQLILNAAKKLSESN